MVAGDAGNLVAQMRRGVLPYCVLAMLREKKLGNPWKKHANIPL